MSELIPGLYDQLLTVELQRLISALVVEGQTTLGIGRARRRARWNGLRTLRPALEGHRQAGRPLRVITTVYTGSTERRALDWLTSIGADVKVSYDTRTTRLHGKERFTGFSTAFIGSSNLTHSALLDGVEWNMRLTQTSTPDLIEKFNDCIRAD